SYALNPLPQKLGRKLGGDFPKVQKALREGAQDSVTAWAQTLEAGQTLTLEIDGQSFEIAPDECEVRFNAAEGFAVAQEKGTVAALDVRLTPALEREGLAREFVRRVQALRKDANFDIVDKIELVYEAEGQLA